MSNRYEAHVRDKLVLHTESGVIEIPFDQIRGGKAIVRVDSKNGPVRVEVVPAHQGRLRGRQAKVFHRRRNINLDRSD